jgi:predicted dehydrogenase
MIIDNNRKFGFGVIGCGMIAKLHAEAIAAIDGAYLVGVADSNKDIALEFAARYDCAAFSSPDELIASNDVDIICICIPSGLHAEYAVRVASAGKHFIVEKPLAITREQLSSVIEACEKNRVKGCVISQLRFAPDVQKAKRAIEDGLIGRIVFADLTMKYHRSEEYYSSSQWRGTKAMDGGGALMNQGIHGIDLIQYLAGPIISVCGVCKTLVHSIEVEDTASLTVEFESGAVGTITGSTSVFPGFPRYIEINGTKGSIALTEDKITRWIVDGNNDTADLNAESDNIASHNDPSQITMDLHKKQIEDMINALMTGGDPTVDVHEGKRAVNVILSAYEAGEKGKKVFI